MVNILAAMIVMASSVWATPAKPDYDALLIRAKALVEDLGRHVDGRPNLAHVHQQACQTLLIRMQIEAARKITPELYSTVTDSAASIIPFVAGLETLVAGLKADARPEEPALTSRADRVFRFYDRDPERRGVLPNPVTVEAERADLGHGYELRVSTSGYSVWRQGTREALASETFGYRDGAETKSLPSTLAPTGQDRWMLAVYSPHGHEIRVYGIEASAERFVMGYLFRVRLFAPQLTSPPYLLFGPSVVFSTSDKRVHAFWFFEEQDDIDEVFVSDGLKHGLSEPGFDRDGRIHYRDGSKRHTSWVFRDDYWASYLRSMRK